MDVEKAKKVFEKYINGKDTMKETLIKAIEVLLNELDKKDKIIDEMAEDIMEYEIDLKYEDPYKNKEQVIDYFKKKAEDK